MTWPIIVGVVAAIFGIWTVSRGRRRLGWGAVVVGILGIALGILGTRSSVSNLNAVFDPALIAQTFAFATPLVFGAIAGMFSERSGVVNIGLEGMMLMGAFWGVWGADKGGTWVVGIFVGMGVGAVTALVYAYFAIHLRADQIVGGTAVNFLALGITGYFFFQLYNGNYIPQGASTIPNINIPWIGNQHFLGPAIGHLSIMIWAGFAAGHRVVLRRLQDTDRPAHPRLRRASACGGHRRHQRLRDPLRLRRAVGDPGGARRRLSLRRLRRRHVRQQHHRRARLHRPGGDDLR